MDGRDARSIDPHPDTTQPDSEPPKFDAIDRTQSPSAIWPPDGKWITMLESLCSFPPDAFNFVMLNLIKNPNITSSHLFRADVFYDSTIGAEDDLPPSGHGVSRNGLAKHLKHELRPRRFALPGWSLDRTFVRQLVPRNPRLDRPLVQTCHFLSRQTPDEAFSELMVVYLPHIDSPDAMPYYHPAVSQLAFHHRWQASAAASPTASHTPPGSVSLSYHPFPDTALSPKLQRTALRLLQTVHKHGQGRLAGYQKRVRLDRVIPQPRYQDTYARLKAKYGRALADAWVEVTDPVKHVFEDIGIAAFLIELWATMYRSPTDGQRDEDVVAGAEEKVDGSSEDELPPFPGFVDIGCGNGVLAYILLAEGYPGEGFDARRRKTWSIFPPEVQARLQQRLLVPEVLLKHSRRSRAGSDRCDDRCDDHETEGINDAMHDSSHTSILHNGVFPPGTFIISNHADELTAWTPLLAYANAGAFIAIPCCSHDLAGARFRAPATVKSARPVSRTARNAPTNDHDRAPPDVPPRINGTNTSTAAPEPAGHQRDLRLAQAAETGSLQRTLVHKKMASAYATLCAYVAALAGAVGFEPEPEVLRIPSTRNQSIIGRRRRASGRDASDEGGAEGESVRCAEGTSVSCAEGEGGRGTNGIDALESMAEREARITRLVEEELGKGIEVVAEEWIERAEKLARKPGSGH